MTEPKRYLFLVLALVAGLSIVGCGGGGSSSPPPVPADFSMSVSPASVNLTQGGASSSMSIAISPLHGFNGSVSVSISGLPAGVTASSIPAIAAGSSGAVSFTAASSATLGPVNLTVSGVSGSLSHSAGAALAVNAAQDFSISIEPAQFSVVQGATSAPATISVAPLNSFSGTVSVDVKGLPAGLTAAQALPLQISAGSKQQITFNATSAAAPGSASLSFRGSSGSLSHSASAALQIQAASAADFAMSLDKSAVVLQSGGSSQTIHLAISPMNQFAGSVSVAISGLPTGVTAALASPTIAAGSSAAVTFSAPKGTAASSNVPVTFTGNAGALTHTATAQAQVQAPAATGGGATTASFSVAYFDSSILPVGTTVPDESIRIVNPGVTSTASALGDLCANIYVFDSSQELKECCSCPVTANGFIRLSVTGNLTSNPSNGAAFNVGSVDVVPSVFSASSPCDPTTVTPVQSLDVWSTHIGARGAGFRLLETLAPSAPLSGSELAELQGICGFIVSNQSGAGLCSCSTD